jgi:hypothetical protein
MKNSVIAKHAYEPRNTEVCRLLSEVFKTNNNPGKYSDSHQLEFVFPIFQSVT